jgi:hypothetical protein
MITPKLPEVPMKSCFQSMPVLFLRRPLHRSSLEAQRVAAHIAIAQEARAAGVGGNHAAKTRIGAQIDGKEQALIFQPAVEIGETQARTGMNGAVHPVQLADAGHPVEAEDALRAGAVRRRAGNEAGIAGLRDQRQAMAHAMGNDGRDFPSGGRAGNESGAPLIVARPGLISRHVIATAQKPLWPKDLPQCADMIFTDHEKPYSAACARVTTARQFSMEARSISA